MHELSIATALAESLIDYMQKNNARVICAHVRVGLLSGIDPVALEFAWEPATANFPGSGLEKCRLQIEQALLKHRCKECGKVFEFKNWQIECPECKIESLRRESGSEFVLESIEVEDV
jgi:hydrogenase nickel insertion protein HypA